MSLSEILPVCLADRLYLSVAVADDKYCISGWVGGRRRLITTCGKFAVEFGKLARSYLGTRSTGTQQQQYVKIKLNEQRTAPQSLKSFKTQRYGKTIN